MSIQRLPSSSSDSERGSAISERGSDAGEEQWSGVSELVDSGEAVRRRGDDTLHGILSEVTCILLRHSAQLIRKCVTASLGRNAYDSII